MIPNLKYCLNFIGAVAVSVALASCIYVGGGVRIPPWDSPTVAGPMTVDGPLTVSGPLTVTGPVVVHGIVKSREIHAAGGVSTAFPRHEHPGPAAQSTSGPMTVAGLLTVHGPLTVDGPLTAAGPVTAEGFEPLGTP